MWKRLVDTVLALALLLTGPLATPSPAQEKADRKIRVLIIDGQNNHDWRATTPVMKKALEDSGRFTVDVATAPQRPGVPPKSSDEAARARYQAARASYLEAMAKFHPDLTRYDVVLSNYNGDPWGKGFQEALDEALKAGRIGLVIVHAANNSFPRWREYNEMIGMGWRNNQFGDRLTLDAQGNPVRVSRGTGPGAGHGARHPFTVTVRDADHPITRGMPHEWLHMTDELYHGMRGPVHSVHLLATAYSDRSKGGTGEHEPMIWTVTYGKGRVFHTPMGHDVTALRCRGFIATLQRGTEWAATGAVTLPLPRDFPTADKTSSIPSR